jgi:hypothetical protein
VPTHRPLSIELPLLPLALALPRMLEQIEAELADVKVSAVEKWRLRQRAELMRGLLHARSDRGRTTQLGLC